MVISNRKNGICWLSRNGVYISAWKPVQYNWHNQWNIRKVNHRNHQPSRSKVAYETIQECKYHMASSFKPFQCKSSRRNRQCRTIKKNLCTLDKTPFQEIENNSTWRIIKTHIHKVK